MLLRDTAEKAKTAVDAKHSVEEMTRDFLFSAKNQVTIWGPNGEINDFSAREWNGVVGDYYYGRWKLYFDMMFDSLDHEQPLGYDVYHNKSIEYALKWDARVGVCGVAYG